MTTNLKITINDKEYTASPGQTILDVVRAHQVDDIPTLCYDPKLPTYGSCYLCVVEIKGLEKLVPSCSSPVADGMVVYTNNDRIRESRRTALELLLSNHYADCLGPCTQTCPAGVDVQGYIALMAMGRFGEAVKLIKENESASHRLREGMRQRVRDRVPQKQGGRARGDRLSETVCSGYRP